MTKKKMAVLAMLGLTTCMSGSLHAANMIHNGGFETLTNGAGQLGFNTDATGWSTTGYNFVFNSGTSDNGGSNGVYGNLQLWGPNNGSANGLPAFSPDGGNFIANDGAFQVGPISQTINFLKVGHTYDVTFYWAAGQQLGFNGATTDQWNVSLGGDTQATSVSSIADHGFSGWQQQTFTYTATSGSEVLSFLANGTPNGVPPFALLDGVSMVDTTAAVPEPSSLVAMFAGLLGLAVIIRRGLRAKKSVS